MSACESKWVTARIAAEMLGMRVNYLWALVRDCRWLRVKRGRYKTPQHRRDATARPKPPRLFYLHDIEELVERRKRRREVEARLRELRAEVRALSAERRKLFK